MDDAALEFYAIARGQASKPWSKVMQSRLTLLSNALGRVAIG